jgi:imidazolonepropionase-like amidohydrolase
MERLRTRLRQKLPAATALIVALAVALAVALPAHADRTLIRDVSVVDIAAGRLLSHHDVLVEDDRIVAVSAERLLAGDARRVDGSGLFLMPGLIDAHARTDRGFRAHASSQPRSSQPAADAAAAISRQQEPRSYLMRGFTTLVQTERAAGAAPAWADAPTHPDLITCHGMTLGGDPGALAITAVAAAGAACIEVFYETPGSGSGDRAPVTAAVLQDLVTAAHDAAMPVLLRTAATDPWGVGADAGVDALIQELPPEPTQDEYGDLSAATRAALDRLIAQGVAVRAASPAASYLAEHGARFLFASDTPYDPSDAGSAGLHGLRELVRLKRIGLSEIQILRAATTSNAALFGLEDELGAVRVGLRADLLLLGSDPLSDINALSDIRMILHDGAWDTPAALSAEHR